MPQSQSDFILKLSAQQAPAIAAQDDTSPMTLLVIRDTLFILARHFYQSDDSSRFSSLHILAPIANGYSRAESLIVKIPVTALKRRRFDVPVSQLSYILYLRMSITNKASHDWRR